MLSLMPSKSRPHVKFAFLSEIPHYAEVSCVHFRFQRFFDFPPETFEIIIAVLYNANVLYIRVPPWRNLNII